MSHAPASDAELAATHKLLVAYHLSVPERGSLPDGHVRISTVVEILKQALAQDGRFPPPRFGRDELVSPVVFREGQRLSIRTRYEIGLERWGPMLWSALADEHEAARRYVRELGATQIDGVPIAWGA